jgi:flagellar basal-body rod protein FlgF
MFVTPRSYEEGMTASVRSMTGDMQHLELLTENASKLGIPGYQANRVVRRPFVEHLGVESVEHVKDQRLGRLRQTGRGEDFALQTPGYFQILNPDRQTVTLTRDGRGQIDSNGFLVTATGEHFLDDAGSPVKFPNKPTDAGKQLKIDADGTLTFLDPKSGKITPHGRLSVVTESGQRPDRVLITPMHLEEGNVTLQEEFLAILPVRRYFEANSQVFKMQSEALQRMLQELGRAQ